MVPEADYYGVIEQYIQKKFNCISTSTNKGYVPLGLVDVIGAYTTSSEFYNDLEIIVVEVKKTAASFGKSIGQALGYSIYGERCYLAITFEGNESYNDDQMYIANHLGVGLIRVPMDKHKRTIEREIEIILTSKKHVPIEAQKRYMLNTIGISRCNMCEIYNPTEQMNRINRNIGRSSLFTNKKSRQFTLCKECYRTFFPKEEKIKRKSKHAAARKAAETMRLKRKGQEDNI